MTTSNSTTTQNFYTIPQTSTQNPNVIEPIPVEPYTQNNSNVGQQVNQPMIMNQGNPGNPGNPVVYGNGNGTYVAHQEQGPYKIHLPFNKTIEVRRLNTKFFIINRACKSIYA